MTLLLWLGGATLWYALGLVGSWIGRHNAVLRGDKWDAFYFLLAVLGPINIISASAFLWTKRHDGPLGRRDRDAKT